MFSNTGLKYLYSVTSHYWQQANKKRALVASVGLFWTVQVQVNVAPPPSTAAGKLLTPFIFTASKQKKERKKRKSGKFSRLLGRSSL